MDTLYGIVPYPRFGTWPKELSIFLIFNSKSGYHESIVQSIKLENEILKTDILDWWEGLWISTWKMNIYQYICLCLYAPMSDRGSEEYVCLYYTGYMVHIVQVQPGLRTFENVPNDWLKLWLCNTNESIFNKKLVSEIELFKKWNKRHRWR